MMSYLAIYVLCVDGYLLLYDFCVCVFYIFFFFKQKTAYEMRISDWSSDVCSSDLSTVAKCGRLQRRRAAFECVVGAVACRNTVGWLPATGATSSEGKQAMAVLVTGAAGFIGFHVAQQLMERGHSVVGIDNLHDYYDPALKQARLARLDGRDRKS